MAKVKFYRSRICTNNGNAQKHETCVISCFSQAKSHTLILMKSKLTSDVTINVYDSKEDGSRKDIIPIKWYCCRKNFLKEGEKSIKSGAKEKKK